MIYVELPSTEGAARRPLPFYLAMEEHLARNFPKDRYFFMWQVEPTVIFGRCQNPFAEVNLDYCRSMGIHTYRRKSGGGCVYADPDNIMLSYVTPTESSVETTFSDYCRMVADMLRTLGLDATTTGRNDVVIEGRKVSGNAFYHLHDRAILHGTMLFDADLPRMTAAITPSQAKLQAKGVASVRSHVTTLREHLPQLGIEEFKRRCRSELCGDRTLQLTREDVAEIERIAEEYFTDEWIWGRFADTAAQRRRVEGVGEFAVDVRLLPPAEPGAPARIEKVNLQGDFFLLADLDDSLLNHLRGVDFTLPAVTEALNRLPVERTIPGLSAQRLADLITCC